MIGGILILLLPLLCLLLYIYADHKIKKKSPGWMDDEERK
jgi:hypothetical protein